MEQLHQRRIFALRVAHDHMVADFQNHAYHLALTGKGLAPAGCTEYQPVGIFVKRNFFRAGKSYLIGGSKREKGAENAPCGRLKRFFVAGNKAIARLEMRS